MQSSSVAPIKTRSLSTVQVQPRQNAIMKRGSAILTAPPEPEQVDFNSFELLQELGSGAFGTVYLAKLKSTGEKFAIKSLNKQFLLKQKQLKYAIRESKILRQMDHPFVIKMYYAFSTAKNLFMVIDYCGGGDIAMQLQDQGKLSEQVSCFYIAETILALEYLHNLEIAFRDLKPANVLLDDVGHVKLADFGLAKESVVEAAAMTMAGSPGYIAPEILNGKPADKSSDLYGLGVMLYELITGKLPYTFTDIPSLYAQIKRGKVDFPDHVSKPARDLIQLLMSPNPKKRPNYENLKRHAFFKPINWGALYRKEIAPTLQQARGRRFTVEGFDF